MPDPNKTNLDIPIDMGSSPTVPAFHPVAALARLARLEMSEVIAILDKSIEILCEDMETVRKRNQGPENTPPPEFAMIAKLQVDIDTFTDVRRRLDSARAVFAGRTMFVSVRESYPPSMLEAILSSLSSRQR